MMNLRNIQPTTLAWLKIIILLFSLLPLFRLVLAAYLEQLGANPIEKLTHSTGYWTLVFLLITLSCTPLKQYLGWLWVIRLRRMLGLLAFFYGSLHFLTYLVLDQFFDWENIINDIIKRPYITIGFSALLMMIPMAISSNNAMIRRLGGKTWRLIHKLIYPCAIFGVIHFCWLVKKDLSNPLIFAVLLVVLLLSRVRFKLFFAWLNKSFGSMRLLIKTAI